MLNKSDQMAHRTHKFQSCSSTAPLLTSTDDSCHASRSCAKADPESPPRFCRLLAFQLHHFSQRLYFKLSHHCNHHPVTFVIFEFSYFIALQSYWACQYWPTARIFLFLRDHSCHRQIFSMRTAAFSKNNYQRDKCFLGECLLLKLYWASIVVQI